MSEPSKITLDSMIFIYLFEEDPRYINEIKPLFEKIEEGGLIAFTSIITPLEVLSSSKLEKEPDKALIFKRFFHKTSNLKIIDVDWKIMETASELRRKNPYLRTPDSLQLATATQTDSKIFITNDKKLIEMDSGGVKKILIENMRKFL